MEHTKKNSVASVSDNGAQKTQIKRRKQKLWTANSLWRSSPQPHLVLKRGASSKIAKNMRNATLDILRVIAMMMIVLMHSPIPGSASGIVLAGISYLTAPGIGLFFMVSGALLLGNKLSQQEFLKRRFYKVLWPTLFWTAFYIAVSCIKAHEWPSLRAILSIPFAAQGHGVLWFMYTLAGLYLLTPILSRWLHSASRREVEFYLLLWGITLLYPYLKMGLEINDGNTGILYYFTGYAGYFLLGYYLKQYPPQGRKFWALFITAVFVSVLAPAIIMTSGIKYNFYEVLWYLSLPVALMSMTWFITIQQLNFKSIPGHLTQCAKLSFGIYLVHIFVMRDILWRLAFVQAMQGILQTLTITCLTFIISWAVAYGISKLPGSKYIVGM